MIGDKLVAERIVRTGSATSSTRKIVLVNGTGREKVEKLLDTPITKMQWGPEFRHGANHIPVEQYAFTVDGVTYERFADATAVVLKKHKVTVLEFEGGAHQIYVQRALNVLRGDEKLRTVTLPESAAPAIKQAA